MCAISPHAARGGFRRLDTGTGASGRVHSIADGVIIGSALIDAVEGAEDLPQAAAGFVRELRTALESSRNQDGR